MLEDKGLRIRGLEDFKTILEFEEEGKESVGVVSHPGWQSHRRCMDEFYSNFRDLIQVEELPWTGILRARQSSVRLMDACPRNYISGRAIVLEEEFFWFLGLRDIPTLVTVPVKPDSEVDNESMYEELIRHLEDPSEMEIRNQGFSVSPAMSSDYVNYLKDLRNGRENFYLVPTATEEKDHEEGRAEGHIYGSPYYRYFETEFVSKFFEIVKGKRVYFGGSNVTGCAEVTLGYLGFVDAEVVFLNQYCGLDGRSQEKFGRIYLKEFPGFREFIENLPRMVRAHPREEEIRGKVNQMMGQMLPRLERRVIKEGPGNHFNLNNVRLYKDYLMRD